MATDNYLRCRLCDWKCLKWKREKGGKFSSTIDDAWKKLAAHYMEEHPEEYQAVAAGTQ